MVLTPFLAHGFALLVALLGPGAFASELSLAEIHCVAGATASGGCFNQALAAYQDALICFVPLAVCRRGLHRPGERALAPTDLLGFVQAARALACCAAAERRHLFPPSSRT